MKNLLITTLLVTFTYADYQELLFNGNCITCHRTDNLNKSAPTIMEIQKRYKDAFPKKKEFVEYMSNWVLKPNVDGSLMIDAIEKYEIMPELAYDKDTLNEISEYIYEKEFNFVK